MTEPELLTTAPAMVLTDWFLIETLILNVAAGAGNSGAGRTGVGGSGAGAIGSGVTGSGAGAGLLVAGDGAAVADSAGVPAAVVLWEAAGGEVVALAVVVDGVGPMQDVTVRHINTEPAKKLGMLHRIRPL